MNKLRNLPPRIRTFDARHVKPLPKVADPFYSSMRWRSLLAQLIAARGRACEDCGRSHDDETGRPLRIVGDHIIELKDGGEPLDPANVRLRCHGCHERKTNQARAARRDQPLSSEPQPERQQPAAAPPKRKPFFV